MNITHVLFSIIAQVSPTPPAGPGSVPAEAVALVSPSPLVMSTPLPIPTPPPEVLEPNFAVRLLEFVGKGGPVMIPMIMLAFLVVVLIVERYLYLRQINRGSVGFTKNFFDLWNSGQIEKASTLAQENEGPIANMLAAGLRAIDRGKQTMREAMQEQALSEAPALNRFMAIIATVGTIMPIMGLLGTVTGMIKTFEVITVKGTGDPKALAGGISEALITTETGLIFAIPILLFHTFLSGRIDRYFNEMEKYATRVLSSIRGGNGE